MENTDTAQLTRSSETRLTRSSETGAQPPQDTGGLTPAQIAIFEAARAAVERLRKSQFADWLVIGAAVVEAKQMAENFRGRKAFQNILQQQKLAEFIGATASRLLKIMSRLDDVKKWHAALEPHQQAAWSAPTTVCRHCPVLQPKKKPTKDGKEKPARPKVNDLIAQVAELEAKLDKKFDGFFEPKDTAKHIAEITVRQFKRLRDDKRDAAIRLIIRQMLDNGDITIAFVKKLADR